MKSLCSQHKKHISPRPLKDTDQVVPAHLKFSGIDAETKEQQRSPATTRCDLRFLDPSFISFLRKGAMEENRQAFEVLIEMLIDSPKASTKAFFSDVLNDVAINDRSIPGNEDLVGVSSRHLVYYLPWPSTIGLNERSDGC
ncbi:unnamed protein product [Sphagnum jensenii]|uniref:Uncharacterized protein n=1 Tax=Sphagnum jensenii TaxID=128206 RepID=A0ABP1B583_9BRYO